MKWLVSLLLALAVGWLAWPRGGEKVESDEVVESSRRGLDREWWEEREGKMTLREMERDATELSDEELWAELERACEDWLKEAETHPWSRPSDWVVMLAREVGARDGEGGLVAVAGFLEELEKKRLLENPEGDKSNLQKLGVSLRYGCFGGWSSARPAEAIGRVLEKRSSVIDGNEETSLHVLLMNPRVVSGFLSSDFWAGQRVLRSALERLVAVDPEQAMQSLVDGTHSFVFDPIQMIGAVLPVLDPRQTETLFDRLESKNQEWGIPLFDRKWREELVSLPIEKKPRLGTNWQLQELARARPEIAKKLLMDGQTDPDAKKKIYLWLVLHDSREIELVHNLPLDLQGDLFANFSDDLSSFSFGPIDGKRGGMLDDLPRHYRTLKAAIVESDLSVGHSLSRPASPYVSRDTLFLLDESAKIAMVGQS